MPVIASGFLRVDNGLESAWLYRR